MNRRSILKAAAAGIAAACGWKMAKREPFQAITLHAKKLVLWHDINGIPITNSAGNPLYVEIAELQWRRKCGECGKQTRMVVCSHCGFDSGVQTDGSYLVPPRFSTLLEKMCNEGFSSVREARGMELL